jgi:hypothetical protein
MDTQHHLDHTPLQYGIHQTAAILGMSPQTLWRRIRSGQLSVPRVDGRLVVPASRLPELLADSSLVARRYRKTRR